MKRSSSATAEPGGPALKGVTPQPETTLSAGPARLSDDEVERRGEEIYERELQAKLEPDRIGDVVAIDAVTGDYEVAGDARAAGDRLRARRPAARIWFMRVGYVALHRFGNSEAAQRR